MLRGKRTPADVAAVEDEALAGDAPADLPTAIFETLRAIERGIVALNRGEELAAITQTVTVSVKNGLADSKTLEYGQRVKYLALVAVPAAVTVYADDTSKPIATIPSGKSGIFTFPPTKRLNLSWAAPAADGLISGTASSHELAAFIA